MQTWKRTPYKTVETMLVSVFESWNWQLFWTFWHCRINTIYPHCIYIIVQIKHFLHGRASGAILVVWYLDLQLPVQAVPITTKVVSLNPVHGEVYSIQHYVIKFVSDMWQVKFFFPDTSVSSANNHHKSNQTFLHGNLCDSSKSLIFTCNY
jgi:hypothetical protein